MTAAPLSHAEIEELLGAYALDAVEPDEREVIEAHLSGCPRCRAEVDAGREVAAGLAQTGAPAPEGVWERIARAIEGETPPPLRLVPAPPAGDEAPPSRPSPRRSPRSSTARRVFLAVASVAAALVVVALVGQTINDPSGSAGSDLAAAAASAFDDPDARLGDLRDDAGTVLATVAVLPDGNAFMRAEDLPQLDEGIYQMWGASPEHVVSLGVFDDSENVIAFHVDPTMDTIMVTHEDEPVERSERPPVVLGELA
jgi:hypothetical protein